jgi:DNA-binding CsgD family transcriptional regulator
MPLSIRVICHSVHFSKMLHKELLSYGLSISDSAENIILVESSLSTASTELENPDIDPSKVIVFTPNPCPEYWDDIINMGVLGLVVNSLTEDMILAAVKALRTKQALKHMPQGKQTALTIQECDVLRLAARSFSNKIIGDIVGKKEKTIINNITKILEKLSGTYPELRLDNRGCLVHYYYGFWNNIGKDCKYSRLAKENRLEQRKTGK